MDLLSSCLHKKSDKHKVNSDHVRSSIVFMQKENNRQDNNTRDIKKSDKKCKEAKQNQKLKSQDISLPMKTILDPRVMKNCQNISNIRLPQSQDNWKMNRNAYNTKDHHSQTLPRSYTTSPTSGFEQFKFDPNELRRSRTMSPVQSKNDCYLPDIYPSKCPPPPYHDGQHSHSRHVPATGMMKHAAKYQMKKTPTFDDFIHSPSKVNPLPQQEMHKRSKSIGDLKSSHSRDFSPENKLGSLEHNSRGLQRSCPIDCSDPIHPHARSRSQGNQPDRIQSKQTSNIKMTEEKFVQYGNSQVYGMPQSRRFSKDIDELVKYNPVYRWYESDVDTDSGIVSTADSVSSRSRGSSSNQDSFRSISSKASSNSRGYGTDSEQGNLQDCFDIDNDEDYLDYAPQAELMRIQSRMYNYSPRQPITMENGTVIPAPPNFPPPPIPGDDPYRYHLQGSRSANFGYKDQSNQSSMNETAGYRSGGNHTTSSNEPPPLPERVGCLRIRPMSPEGNKEITKRVAFADSVKPSGIKDDSNISRSSSESKNIHPSKSPLNRSNSLPHFKRDKHAELARKQEALNCHTKDQYYNGYNNPASSNNTSNNISNGHISTQTQRSHTSKTSLSPVYESKSSFLQKSNQVTHPHVEPNYQILDKDHIRDCNNKFPIMRDKVEYINVRYNTESVHL